MILPGGPQEIQSPPDKLISDPERKKEKRWEGWREAGNKGGRVKGNKRGSDEEKGIQKETKTNKYKQHVHVHVHVHVCTERCGWDKGTVYMYIHVHA